MGLGFNDGFAPIEEVVINVKKEHLPPGIVITIKDNGVTYRMDCPVLEEYTGEYG
jgi:hypothetical protein